MQQFSETPDAELMGALHVTAHLYLRQRQREGADVSRQRRSLRRREEQEATYCLDACALVREALSRRPGRAKNLSPIRARGTSRRPRFAPRRTRRSRRVAARGDPGEPDLPGLPKSLAAAVALLVALDLAALLAPRVLFS